MADHSQPVEQMTTPALPPDESSDGEVVSLKPLYRLLATYRRVLALIVGAAVVSCVLLLLILLLVLPTERTASIQFRLLFDGASEGRYPNGTTFSPAEVIATPVLAEVYRANQLERFGKYGDFKDSMTVLHSSLALDLLAASYSSRLADIKLTPVDRIRLEEEFRKKREAMTDPVYTLMFRRNGRLTVMPSALTEKVLNDVLTTWAKQADELKGATHFNVPVLSRDSLTPDLLSKDFMMAADDLRVQARRAAAVAQALMLVPGATTIRTQKDQISLADVSYSIADTLRNQIEPVLYLIQESGLTNDPQAMAHYLHGHAVELRLDRNATQARIQLMQDALDGYMTARASRPRDGAGGSGTTGRPAQGLETQTVIPQISDSFLDRIIQMSTQTEASDVAFRQRLTDRVIKEGETLSELDRSTAYYEQLEKTVRIGAKKPSEAEAQAVRAQLRAAFDTIHLAVERLMRLYDELSAQRLYPAAVLYSVSTPFAITTQRGVTWGTGALVLTIAILLALVGGPIGCAIHQSSSRRAAAFRAR